MTDWIVLKFGGTSVARREGWETIGRLMRQRHAEEGASVLVVVSALAGVTNALQAICDTHADRAAVRAGIDALVHRHEDFADELGVDRGAIRDRLAGLIGLGIDPRADAGGLDWQAEVLAQGELLSSTLGVAFLRAQGLPVDWCDSRDWLRARPLPNQGDWSRWLSASCPTELGGADTAATRARFAAAGPALRVAQGFIARAADGGTARASSPGTRTPSMDTSAPDSASSCAPRTSGG